MIPFPSTPPSPQLPRPWNFPERVIRQATPGVDVVVVRMPALPIVTVRWCFLSAGLYEDVNRIGSAVLLQRLLRHGTANLNATAFARQLDRQGIRLGTQVSADSMIVSVTALREHLLDAIQIANDVSFLPRLPEPALTMERMRTQHAHHQAEGQIESMVSLWLNHAVYGAHPYGRPPSTLSGLRATTIEDVQQLRRRVVESTRAMLLVVGDVEPHQTADMLAKKVSLLPVADTPDHVEPAPISADAGGVWLVERSGAEQVAIGVGTRAPPRNHPDFLALRVVNHILGGGASSRLFSRLRDQEGLTYGAYSRLDCGRWAGDWTANLTVAPQKVGRTLPLVRAEFEKVAAGEISEAQLKHAVQYLAGSFPQRACGLSGVSSLTTAAWMHDLSPDVWRNYQEDLLRVSLERIRSVAKKWIRPQDLCWVLAGPPDALQMANSQIGELHPLMQRVEMASLTE